MIIRNYFCIAAFFLALIACDGPAADGSANVQLVEDYVQAVENLDYQAMDDYLADDYMGYGPSINDSINKENGIASWRANVENLYERIDYRKSRNLAVSVADGDNAGEWVSNWAELEIVYKDGESVVVMANTIYKIANGKISRSYTFYNEADVLEQLGYIFINPNDL